MRLSFKTKNSKRKLLSARKTPSPKCVKSETTSPVAKVLLKNVEIGDLRGNVPYYTEGRDSGHLLSPPRYSAHFSPDLKAPPVGHAASIPPYVGDIPSKLDHAFTPSNPFYVASESRLPHQLNDHRSNGLDMSNVGDKSIFNLPFAPQYLQKTHDVQASPFLNKNPIVSRPVPNFTPVHDLSMNCMSPYSDFLLQGALYRAQTSYKNIEIYNMNSPFRPFYQRIEEIAPQLYPSVVVTDNMLFELVFDKLSQTVQEHVRTRLGASNLTTVALREFIESAIAPPDIPLVSLQELDKLSVSELSWNAILLKVEKAVSDVIFNLGSVHSSPMQREGKLYAYDKLCITHVWRLMDSETRRAVFEKGVDPSHHKFTYEHLRSALLNIHRHQLMCDAGKPSHQFDAAHDDAVIYDDAGSPTVACEVSTKSVASVRTGCRKFRKALSKNIPHVEVNACPLENDDFKL